MIDFERLLARVGSGVDRGALSQHEAAHYIGEHIARRLYCSSASLWALAGTAERRVFTRVGGFDAVANRPLAEPLEVVDAQAGDWYDTLARRRLFASPDSASDPRLPGMHQALVGVRRVRGMLQAAIGANAGLWGFVSCTQYDTARLWTPREVTQLQRMAAALTLHHARKRTRTA